MKFNFQVEISLFSHLAIKLTAQQRCCVVRFIAKKNLMKNKLLKAIVVCLIMFYYFCAFTH